MLYLEPDILYRIFISQNQSCSIILTCIGTSCIGFRKRSLIWILVVTRLFRTIPSRTSSGVVVSRRLYLYY